MKLEEKAYRNGQISLMYDDSGHIVRIDLENENIRVIVDIGRVVVSMKWKDISIQMSGSDIREIRQFIFGDHEGGKANTDVNEIVNSLMIYLSVILDTVHTEIAQFLVEG